MTCLFSAPFSFLGELKEDFQRFMPTEFREIWRREELGRQPDVVAWVPNPGQHFVIDDAALELLPALELLVTPSTGTNHIARDACMRRGVGVYSLLDHRQALDQISASAEFTFLLLLNALRRIDLAAAEVASGRWREREERLRGRQLQGLWVGLVGLGRIGRRLARYGEAFGARTAYYDPYVSDPNLPALPLEELFERSDAVCICCRLTPETRGMIAAPLLRRLKFGGCLVNTSRGEVINEEDLAALLKARPDLRVALDVLAGEAQDLHGRSPLLEFQRSGQIVITPHIAGATAESQTQAARAALELLQRHLHPTVLGGRP